MTGAHGHPEGIQRIRASLRSARESQIYVTFARLGIGEALDAQTLDVDQLATRIEVEKSALRRYLSAAKAFGIVEVSEDDLVSLTDLGYDVFSPGGQHSMVHMLKLEGAFFERWGKLAEAVRSGVRPEANRAQEDAPDWVRTFTLALYDSSRRAADVVARGIDAVLPQPTETQLRLIDVGGGHGAYSLSIARLRADIDAIVFDLPRVIPVTEEIIAESGLSPRVGAVAGDFHSDPLGIDYDLALLFGVLHGETSEGSVKLLHAARQSLKSDGLLLIRSHGGRSGPGEPGEREITDLHMLLSTAGGQAQASEDVMSLVTRNGFTFQGEQEIEQPVGGSLLVFRRGG